MTSDQELRRYDRFVSEVVAAARLRFLENRNGRGKGGWDDPEAWHYRSQPLHLAIEEVNEAQTEDDLGKRLWELGDALNFLAFDLAVQRARQSELSFHPTHARDY